jgi:hypothetical protein
LRFFLHINISLYLTEIERNRNIRNEQFKSSNNHGEIKFYYGLRNILLVKLDEDVQEDGLMSLDSVFQLKLIII